MITKVKNVINVGRLKKAGGTTDEYNLSKLSLVYSGNTHGKSTFVSILRSLSNNNPALIVGRQSFGATGKQNVILQLGSGGDLAIFKDGAWSKSLESIRIFDSKYINESFFSPDQQIDDNGQRKIETFILGRKGKEIAEKIQKLEKDQGENKNEKSAIARAYTAVKQPAYPDFDKFLKLKPIDKVEELLSAEKDKLTSYNNQSKIQTLIEGLVGKIGNLSLQDMKKNLAKTLEVDTSQISQHIQDHVKTGSDKRALSDFFEKGLSFSDNKHCAYCGQTINDAAQLLLDAYNQIYNDSYKALSASVKTAREQLKTLRIVDDIRKTMGQLTDLKVTMELPKEMGEKGEEIDLLDAISNALTIFEKEIETKQENFNHAVDFHELEKILVWLGSIKSIADGLLKQYSGDVSSKMALCQKQILEYEIHKLRQSELWVKNCSDYTGLEKTGKDISKDLRESYKKQADYATNVFSDCEDLINRCLKYHGANYKIGKLAPKGRTKGELFQLIFDEESEVGLTGDEKSYSVKNTLSESDKRLLCFSFFMASIQKELDGEKLIVVLDDPMSSFDFERRGNMASYIAKFFRDKTPEQIIILSHDKWFIKQVGESVSSADIAIKKLTFNRLAGTSDFSALDIQTDPMYIEDEYYRYRNRLIAYKNMSDDEILDNTDMLVNIRKIIEFILKHKYYDDLESDITKGKSIVTFVETLSKSDKPYGHRPDIKKKISELIPHKPAHDPNVGDYKIETLGAHGIRGIIDKAFSVVKEL